MKTLTTLFCIIICFAAFGQQPIFATISGGDLYSFDLGKCKRNFIGVTGYGFGDIAFTPNGRLWGIEGGMLYNIDTSNANSTLIGNTEIGAVTLLGLNDTTLLAEFGNNLYSINVNTAASTYIDTIGYSAAGDLVWYDNDLYLVTPLVKITMNSTYTDILSVTLINDTVPTCEGAVTASFTGDFNSIVGFNGDNAIKICQLDGSHQVLCPELNPGGTPGAASIRLPTQNPQPAVCSVKTGEESLLKNQFSIYPNPATGVVHIGFAEENLIEKITAVNSLAQQVSLPFSLWGYHATADITGLQNGVYFLRATSHGKEHTVGRFMKVE
ncbi:MAG TPA: T9SS type A sorting domain-containing protein [Chitinophagales bacterium]|nr:T9SS type A sorting domain-containing protein [Chitinophagales bacterium]